ncbi:MAG: D-alanine--D-alanine ligase [Chromatiales bacterium]|jgi:D-alanine-D-alanine ligase
MSRAADFGKVAVLMGGTAAEREISLISGNAVLEALLRQQVDAHAVDVGADVIEVLQTQRFDRAFNVLHGRGGEDGVIQGALETIGLPYTGSGVMGSAISMDKYRTKLVWLGLGLPTPGFVLLHEQTDLQHAIELGFPLIVKPVHEGSSIGMAYVEDVEQLRQAWADAASYDNLVMAEKWVTGREYTAAILGQQALPLIRLKTPNRFYDYQAKYESDQTEYLIPCGLDADKESTFQQLTLKAFEATGTSGWGRVDFLVDENDQPWLIEVNSVPGMTSHSLVPMAARAVGISFDELVWKILEQTLEA